MRNKRYVLRTGNSERLIKQRGDNDENLNYFRAVVPYVKQLAPTQKLFLRSQFQNMVAEEMGALQNNLFYA